MAKQAIWKRRRAGCKWGYGRMKVEGGSTRYLIVLSGRRARGRYGWGVSFARGETVGLKEEVSGVNAGLAAIVPVELPNEK